MRLPQFRRYLDLVVLVTPLVAAACGGRRARRCTGRDGGHRDRRLEHRVSCHRSRGRGVPEGDARRARHRRPLRNRRRVPEVLPQRDRGLERVAADHRRPRSRRARQAGVDFIELPVAYDGLTVVVHPKNTWATSITVAELKKLWEPAAQGKVTRWNQIRPSWPNQEVHLFGPGVDSGTFDYFTEVINGKAKASRGDYTSSEDDNVLVQGVGGDTNALGYMGLAYYVENKDRMKVVPVDDGDPSNGAGPIEPSVETVRGGTYRPLSRPLFIYVNAAALSPAGSAEVRRVLRHPRHRAHRGSRLRAAVGRRTAARARSFRGQDDRHDVRRVVDAVVPRRVSKND